VVVLAWTAFRRKITRLVSCVAEVGRRPARRSKGVRWPCSGRFARLAMSDLLPLRTFPRATAEGGRRRWNVLGLSD